MGNGPSADAKYAQPTAASPLSAASGGPKSAFDHKSGPAGGNHKSGGGGAAGGGAGINKLISPRGQPSQAGTGKRGERKKYKILLLGSSESGKSTIFKQLINTYAKNFWTDSERLAYLPIMHENMVSNMKSLIDYVRTHSNIKSKSRHHAAAADSGGDDAGGHTLPPVPPFEAEHDEMAHAISELRREEISGVPLTAIRQSLTSVLEIGIVELIVHYYGGDLGHIWEKMAALWSTASIITAYHQARSSLNLTDSAKYFFDRILEVTHDDYLPTPNDVLRVLNRTQGLVEGEFEIDSQNIFHVYDLGGTRDQRTKWIHVYEDVDAYVYCAAVSEYDQLIVEDGETNRLIEAMSLFERDIAGNRWFRNSTKCLLLTKSDVFVEKFVSQKVPLQVCFPEYPEVAATTANAEHAMQHILEQFEVHAKDKGIPNLNSYLVNALDAAAAAPVLNAVKAAILHEAVNKEDE